VAEFLTAASILVGSSVQSLLPAAISQEQHNVLETKHLEATLALKIICRRI
jgi:hypothetical protein